MENRVSKADELVQKPAIGANEGCLCLVDQETEKEASWDRQDSLLA